MVGGLGGRLDTVAAKLEIVAKLEIAARSGWNVLWQHRYNIPSTVRNNYPERGLSYRSSVDVYTASLVKACCDSFSCSSSLGSRRIQPFLPQA